MFPPNLLFRRATSLALLLLAAAPLRAAETWWQQPAAQSKPVTEWLATDLTGKPAKLEMKQVGEARALVAASRPIKLTSPAKIAPNSEVTIYFTANPTGKTVASFKASIGEEGAPGLPVTVTATGGSDTLAINAAGVAASYQTRGNYTRSLSWPEELRKLIEAQMASMPRLAERTFSLRCVLRKDRFEVYLNDILISARAASPIAVEPAKAGAKPLPPVSIGGPLTLTLPAQVEVISVQTRALVGQSPLFEPVRIDSRLNAAQINGVAMSSAALPAADEPAMVRGVPFVFPRRDSRGNDHLDVGASWLQSCYLEGDSDPHRGAVGGRWSGALVENPTRLQFQIPKGRYRALHIIAAADGEADSAPVVTAQFFRPAAGAPVNFAARVPLLTAKSTDAVPLPIQLGDGQPAKLWLVTIPIDPGALADFDDLDACGLELTKQVQLFRAYPDPTQYSAHAAGLPSAVHVYAMTLERPAAALDLQPDALGHLWTAPARPAYTVKLQNLSGQARPVKLELTTISYDGTSRTVQERSVPLSVAGGTAKFNLKPERYGYHDVILKMTDGDATWTERRSLGWLQSDNRARGDWAPGRGASFGFWDWAGGHTTPPRAVQIELMSRLGAEWVNHTLPKTDEAGRAAAEQFHVASLVQGGASHYYTAAVRQMLDDPAKARESLIENFRKNDVTPSAIEKPDSLSFFAEPQLGQITTGIPPDYYGEPYTFTADEEERYQGIERTFVFGARAAKEFWPGVKCQFAYGDPLFPVYFLRRSQDVRELMDGINVDISVFDRMPENQIHQVSIHRCYVMQQELRRAGLKNPNLVMVEGPSIPTRPGALSMAEQADNWVRVSLLLYGYGIDRQIGGWAFECANYWGEQHYGGGIFNRVPLVTPKPSACALATMTRHINRKNLTKWLPTGSLSAYALQFQHYQSGALTHVFWTVRGRRPVTLTVPKDAKLTLFDSMDNPTVLPNTDGRVTFTISTSPCYVEGLTGDSAVALGEPDNSDAQPASLARKLANPGADGWRISPEEDAAYAKNSPLQVARFSGAMTAQSTEAPAENGGRALAVHLGAQPKEQKLMPFYTTLVPPKPITIAGKASQLGLWVKAASDWGRVVYSLRDAEGERWLSVGTFSGWNCDDPRSLSFFNFDGWRYLCFELPANSPYDRYREIGSTWWGHSGKGNGQVDLPLTLEKIIVERRTHAMYVNDPQPARPDDVLLGDLNAEYARPEDQTEEAVRLDHLRMPVPKDVPELGNPITELKANGVGSPVSVTNITLPTQDADGTRCFVYFQPVDGAKSYDVWASPYPDGRGALQLGKAWKEPGRQITGLRPDTDFYLFVTYADADNKTSKPSAPFQIRLKDIFGMK